MTSGQPFADSERSSRVRNIGSVVGRFILTILAMTISALSTLSIAFPETRSPISDFVASLNPFAPASSNEGEDEIDPCMSECSQGTHCAGSYCVADPPEERLTITFNAQLNGGGGTNYLAFNSNGEQCALAPGFTPMVNGQRVVANAVPWHCLNNSESCFDYQPRPNEGCEVQIILPSQ